MSTILFPGFANPMTANGDTIYGGLSGTPSRRSVGTEGQLFKIVGGVPAWADSAVSAYKLSLISDGITFVDRGLFISQHSNDPASAPLSFKKSRGNLANPVNCIPGDLIGLQSFVCYLNNSYTSDRSFSGAIVDADGIAQVIITGSTNANYTPTFRVAGNQQVGIGNFGSAIPYSLESLPEQLSVNGRVYLRNQSAPATPVNGGVIYVEGGTLKYKGSSGMVTILGLA